MKIFPQSKGWVSYGNKLYWTNDGGEVWIDITPRPSGIKAALPGLPRLGASLGSIFFRDAIEGWAIISYPEQQKRPEIASMQYMVAHTTDSGTSWSFMPLTYPALRNSLQDTLAGPADMFFIDSQHGWLDIAFEGMSKPGNLLATDDGGKTWNWVNNPGFSGPITFASSQDGWLLSNWGADRLYVTHDGCKSWNEVTLSPPNEVGAAIYPTFQGPPIFKDEKKGYLVVHYSASPGVPSKLVVYSTTNAGYSWQPVKILTEAEENTRSANFPFSIIDSSIVVVTGPTSHGVSVASVPLNGGVSDVKPSTRGATALVFADDGNGWLSSDGTLLVTHDGGTVWKGVKPSHASSLPAKNGAGAEAACSDRNTGRVTLLLHRKLSSYRYRS